MTEYQKAQLLHKHMTGDFKYRNVKGNKVSRSAWTKMLSALIDGGYIERRSAYVTNKGRKFCEKNHLDINLAVLS